MDGAKRSGACARGAAFSMPQSAAWSPRRRRCARALRKRCARRIRQNFHSMATHCVLGVTGAIGFWCARLLLDRGVSVFAIEPNVEMRTKAEATLGDRPGFVSVAARAEATTLAPGSADWVFAAA